MTKASAVPSRRGHQTRAGHAERAAARPRPSDFHASGKPVRTRLAETADHVAALAPRINARKTVIAQKIRPVHTRSIVDNLRVDNKPVLERERTGHL